MKAEFQDRLHGGKIITHRMWLGFWPVKYESSTSLVNRHERKIEALIDKAWQEHRELLRIKEEIKSNTDAITKMHGKENHTGSYTDKLKHWTHKFIPWASVADVAPCSNDNWKKVIAAYGKLQRPDKPQRPNRGSNSNGNHEKNIADQLVDEDVTNFKVQLSDRECVVKSGEDGKEIVLGLPAPKQQHGQGKQRNRGRGNNQNNS